MTWRTRGIASAAAGIALACGTVFCGGPEFEADTSIVGDDGGGANDGTGFDALVGDARFDRDAARDAREDQSSGDDDGPTTGDDGSNDAPADSPSDAPTILDSSTFDGGGFTCAAASTTMLFCDDFEGANDILPGPFSSQSASGGTNSIDTTEYESSKHSYLATTSFSATSSAYAYLLANVTTAAAKVDFGFSIFPKTVSTTASNVTLASFAIGSTVPRQLTLTLVQSSSGLTLVEAAGESDGGIATANHPLGITLPASKWSRLRVTVDRTTTTSAKVIVTLDESTTFQFTSIAGLVDASDVYGEVGVVNASSPAGSNAVAYDDVVIRTL